MKSIGILIIVSILLYICNLLPAGQLYEKELEGITSGTEHLISSLQDITITQKSHLGQLIDALNDITSNTQANRAYSLLEHHPEIATIEFEGKDALQYAIESALIHDFNIPRRALEIIEKNIDILHKAKKVDQLTKTLFITLPIEDQPGKTLKENEKTTLFARNFMTFALLSAGANPAHAMFDDDKQKKAALEELVTDYEEIQKNSVQKTSWYKDIPSAFDSFHYSKMAGYGDKDDEKT